MTKNKILGGLSPAQFLREYWQKKPLLIRNAFFGFNGLLSKEELLSISFNEDALSRLVGFSHKKWTLLNGPFKKRDFAKFKQSWTLLIQGINHFLPEAQTLLKAFSFIPHARLDDLMVSFATDGGGVGPHIDSYDVFLLQGTGKRLWQISAQEDHSLLPDVPLKILKHFKPENEWLLEPGDMLYLPPNYAHNGIAVGECMTYSIGFRAPTHQELVREFLIYLQDHLEIEGIYADPKLKITQHPAHISDDMLDQVATVLKKIRFDKMDIKNFLGSYLSEPKSHVFFDPPEVPFEKSKFLKLARKKGICLDLKSQMLFTDEMFFINGEAYPFCHETKPLMQKLADTREVILPTKIYQQTEDFLYRCYLDGYLAPIF